VANISSLPAVDFLVTRFSDIDTKVIYFLHKHPLESVKQKDFKYFCEAPIIIGSKKHLTAEGVENIKNI
jgi:hypothetical protein